MCLLIYHLEPILSSNAVQTILASTRMKVQLNIQLSQGSAATNLRGGGKFNSSFTCGSYQNTTVKELLKSVHICQSYPKNITCTFFMVHGVQGESKKSRPPTSFIDIFAWAQSFCIKFYTFIGNIYPRMYADFRSFILTFSEMALILLRAPIIFIYGFKFRLFSNQYTLQKCRVPAYGKCYCFRHQMFNVM